MVWFFFSFFLVRAGRKDALNGLKQPSNGSPQFIEELGIDGGSEWTVEFRTI